MLLDVPVDVLDGRLDDVQRITELVELGTRDDQLGLAEARLSGSLSCFEVTLAARLAAELAWSPGADRLIDLSTAPMTPV